MLEAEPFNVDEKNNALLFFFLRLSVKFITNSKQSITDEVEIN